MVRNKLNIKIDKSTLSGWKILIKRKASSIINYGPIAKIIATIIVWSIALIPSYIYFFLRWLFEPVTFWENIALFIGWVIFLGVIQAGALVFATMLTLFLITENW